MLYSESNCDLYSAVRGREAHGNTGAAPRAAPLQAGIMITAVRSVTSGCTTFLQNGIALLHIGESLLSVAAFHKHAAEDGVALLEGGFGQPHRIRQHRHAFGFRGLS